MDISVANCKMSELRLDNLYFDHIEYTSKGPYDDRDKNCSVRLDYNKKILKNDGLSINLLCNVKIDDKSQMQVSLIGVFTISGNSNIDKFLPNALAIMFPYMRSQVSLITTQPGCPVLVLPPLNINTMLKTEHQVQ